MRADAGSGVKAAFKTSAADDAIIPVDNADSWIVGSDRMNEDTADATKDYRAFFNKTKGAFRAGEGRALLWDDANVGYHSHASGRDTKASGHRSHAEGDGAAATGQSSHAECYRTVASGIYSHAEGNLSEASGQSAHAEGDSTTASGTGAHAEGNRTTASGPNAHAEGLNTTASGPSAHAEGNGTTASANQSHAEGWNSRAEGTASSAGGHNAKTTRFGQWARAVGLWNAGDAQASSVVASRATTSATPTVLVSSPFNNVVLTGADTSVLTLLASRAHRVVIDAVARRTDVQGEMAGFSWECLVGRDSTGSARIIGDPLVKAWSDAGAAAWTLTVGINTTDATNNYLEILATGEAGKTIRWVAEIRTVEVAG